MEVPDYEERPVGVRVRASASSSMPSSSHAS